MSNMTPVSHYEKFKFISDQTNRNDKISAIKRIKTPAFIEFLDYVYNPNVWWIIPNKEPISYTKNKEHKKFLLNRLTQEHRLIKTFTNLSEYPMMSKNKLISLFIDLLETIDVDDAELLISLKNNDFLFKDIDKELFEEAIPELKEKWKKG